MAKVGRPLKKIEDCLPVGWQDVILEMSAEGLSDVEIRAKLCLLGGKFNHEIWYALIEREKEFSEIIKKGKVLCQAWWEEQGRKGLHDQYFQPALWFINMKNRFKDDWKDKTDIEHSVSDSTIEKFKDISSGELLDKARAIINK